MAQTLTGNAPKDTYKGLIKTGDSGEVLSDKQLSDGNGNDIPLKVSPTSVTIQADLKDNAGNAGSTGMVLSKTDTGVEWTSRTFTFNQVVSTNTWTIAHNVGSFPSVTVVDSVGNIVVGDISYPDDRTVVLTFKTAFKGKAYLN